MIAIWGASVARREILRLSRRRALSWPESTPLIEQAIIAKRYFHDLNIHAKLPATHTGIFNLEVSEGPTYMLIAFRNTSFFPNDSFFRDIEGQRAGRRGNPAVIAVTPCEQDSFVLSLAIRFNIPILYPSELRQVAAIIKSRPHNVRAALMAIPRARGPTTRAPSDAIPR